MPDAPVCPVHGGQLRPGKTAGSFFCAKFIGLGAKGANDKGFCDFRISAPRHQSAANQAPAPIQPPSVVQHGARPEVGSDALTIAALGFAGKVFAGGYANPGVDMVTGLPRDVASEALACFQKALEIARRP